MKNTVFISYAHDDKLVADAVCARIEQAGFRCWIAPRDIQPGREWMESIISAIESAGIMVLVFSRVSNESKQVLNEVTAAAKHEVIIIPFRLDAVTPRKSMEYFLNVPHWLDAMTPPLEQHLEALAQTICRLFSTGGYPHLNSSSHSNDELKTALCKDKPFPEIIRDLFRRYPGPVKLLVATACLLSCGFIMSIVTGASLGPVVAASHARLTVYLVGLGLVLLCLFAWLSYGTLTRCRGILVLAAPALFVLLYWFSDSAAVFAAKTGLFISFNLDPWINVGVLCLMLEFSWFSRTYLDSSDKSVFRFGQRLNHQQIMVDRFLIVLAAYAILLFLAYYASSGNFLVIAAAGFTILLTTLRRRSGYWIATVVACVVLIACALLFMFGQTSGRTFPDGAVLHELAPKAAILRGGWFGCGFGRGELAKHAAGLTSTDVVAAIVGEQFGVAGLAVIVFFSALMVVGCIQIARRASDHSSIIVGLGVAVWVTFGVLVHLATVFEIIPVSGAPLPLVSSGPHLIVFMVAIGILLSVAHHSESRNRKAVGVLCRWDPIGIYEGGGDWSDDVYEKYAPSITRMLDAGCTAEVLAKRLKSILTKRMERPCDDQKYLTIAEDLVSLKKNWDDVQRVPRTRR